MYKIESMYVLKTLKNFIGIFSDKVNCEVFLDDLLEIGFDKLENKVNVSFILEDILKFNNIFMFE